VTDLELLREAFARDVIDLATLESLTQDALAGALKMSEPLARLRRELDPPWASGPFWVPYTEPQRRTANAIIRKGLGA
jgi:hypothetical protein